MYNEFMKFKKWVNDKYIDWRGDTRATISDFAAYIGVSQTTMSTWMNSDFTPNAKSLQKIAVVFPEIYDALGLKSTAASAADWLASLSPDERTKFNSAYIAALRELELKEIESASPEGEKLIRSVLERFGL